MLTFSGGWGYGITKLDSYDEYLMNNSRLCTTAVTTEYDCVGTLLLIFMGVLI